MASFYDLLRDRLAALGGEKAGANHAVDTAVPGMFADQRSEPAGGTNADAFQFVCQMLHDRHGRKIPNTPQGTLNRLFRKHLAGRYPAIAEDAPELTCENTWVTRETRPKLNFVGLSRRLESGPKVSFDVKQPILIARYRGVDCLLDGNKRCRYWYNNGDTGLHDALVLIIREVQAP